MVALFLAGFEQRTVRLGSDVAGIREQISPTILAVATILVCISVLLLATMELCADGPSGYKWLKPELIS